MITKKDYLIGGLVGFLTGVFIIPVLVNLNVRGHGILFAVPLVIPFVFAFGVWLGKFLSRFAKFFAEFGKFAAVGFLNTAIDFGVLNLLSATTGVTQGFILGGVNVPGFSVAVFNSYFWNKFWVFPGRNSQDGIFHDFAKFLGVTLIGLLINSSIIISITTYVSPQFGFHEAAWLNIAKAAATIVSFTWNFVGFKFFVFRSQ